MSELCCGVKRPFANGHSSQGRLSSKSVSLYVPLGGTPPGGNCLA